MEEEEEDVDNETIALRLLDNLKFQVLCLRLNALLQCWTFLGSSLFIPYMTDCCLT